MKRNITKVKGKKFCGDCTAVGNTVKHFIDMKMDHLFAVYIEMMNFVLLVCI